MTNERFPEGPNEWLDEADRRSLGEAVQFGLSKAMQTVTGLDFETFGRAVLYGGPISVDVKEKLAALAHICREM